MTDRVPGLDVDLVSSDDAVLLVVRGRLPVDDHSAGVERFGGHVSRLPRHWASYEVSVRNINITVKSVSPLDCHIQIVFTRTNQLKKEKVGNVKDNPNLTSSQHLLH